MQKLRQTLIGGSIFYLPGMGFGFGAVYGKRWFCAPWLDSFSVYHINIKELFAIVAAVLSWGSNWRDQQILFYTDSLSITHVWRYGTSSDRLIMRLIRHLFLFTARLNINVLMQHRTHRSY